MIDRQPTIGAHADFAPGDYRFARQRSDATPLQKSPPVESLGRSAANTIGLIVFILVAFGLAHAAARLLTGLP